MKVILLRDDRHLGKRGDVVNVKPGYARNFLCPKEWALEATPGNLKFFEEQRKKIDARHSQEKEAAEAVAAELAALEVVIAKKVGETETLYGSVTATDIADALAAQGVKIDRRHLDLGGGIKTLGEHVATLDLHTEVVAQIKVQVVREE